MILITAVIVSLIILSTGSAVSKIGESSYQYREEGYMANIIISEAGKIDTRFRKERENFKKMIGFLDGYTTDVKYWETGNCFNITLDNTESSLNLNCVS